MSLALRGKVVTFDAARRELDDGVVYIDDDGVIKAVVNASESPPEGFAPAKTIQTNGVIYPGLIDLHSHLAYNTLPLWVAKGVPYVHHDAWVRETRAPDYSSTITWPSKVLQVGRPEALIKYVEVKALVGGTTSVQGGPKTTRHVKGWLVRILESEPWQGQVDPVRPGALQKSTTQLRAEAKKLAVGGNVLVYHLAEGRRRRATDPAGARDVREEYFDLRGTGCLQPGLIGVHCGALTKTEFKEWRQKVKERNEQAQPTLVWSPFSNLWLYGETTDVIAAREQGFRITLGSDWSPSGTKHVLGELKVADIYNQRRLNGKLTDRELCELVTANPGEALATTRQRGIGALAPNMEGDVLVLEPHKPNNVHRNLIDATERHVQLVVIRGKAFYGTRTLMRAAGATGANAITVAGQKRSVLVRMPGADDAKLNWSGVKKALNEARADPKAVWDASTQALAAWGGALDDPDAPLAIFGDMPEGDLGIFAATGELPEGTTVPPLESLEHDDAFFDAVDANGDPILGELRSRYE